METSSIRKLIRMGMFVMDCKVFGKGFCFLEIHLGFMAMLRRSMVVLIYYHLLRDIFVPNICYY